MIQLEIFMNKFVVVLIVLSFSMAGCTAEDEPTIKFNGTEYRDPEPVPDFNLTDLSDCFSTLNPIASSFINLTPKLSAFRLKPFKKSALSNQPSPDLP